MDALCRAVTGGGGLSRKLYADDQAVGKDFLRALIVTGVNNPAERGDFMDRTLPVVLDRIPPHERRPLEDLKAELLAARPAIMGGLFSALSAAIRSRPALDRLPRLADWGRYAAGVYAALDWGVVRFLEAIS